MDGKTAFSLRVGAVHPDLTVGSGLLPSQLVGHHPSCSGPFTDAGCGVDQTEAGATREEVREMDGHLVARDVGGLGSYRGVALGELLGEVFLGDVDDVE